MRPHGRGVGGLAHGSKQGTLSQVDFGHLRQVEEWARLLEVDHPDIIRSAAAAGFGASRLAIRC